MVELIFLQHKGKDYLRHMAINEKLNIITKIERRNVHKVFLI